MKISIIYKSSYIYDTDEIRYTTAKNYDEEGNLTGETEEAEPTPYQKTALCKKMACLYLDAKLPGIWK